MRFEEPMKGQMISGASDFWFEFEVNFERLTMADGKTPLGDPPGRRLITIQLAALHQLQDAVAEEIQRLSNLLSATR